MTIKQNEIENEFLTLTKHLGAMSGMDSLSATMFALLYIEPGEMTMDELAHKSGYSLASISQKLKTIMPLGLIKKHTQPGSKKVYLSIEKDLISLWKEQLLSIQAKKLKIAKSESLRILIKYKSHCISEREKKIYKNIENYHKQAVKFNKIFNKIMKIFSEVKV